VLPEILHSTSSRQHFELKLGIAVYSKEEKAEMLLIYGERGKNYGQTVAAVREQISREDSAISTDGSSVLLKTSVKQKNISPMKPYRRNARMDTAPQVAVLGAVADTRVILSLRSDKLKVTLESVGSTSKTMHNSVNGHSNNSTSQLFI
jgi:hypothetical protein